MDKPKKVVQALQVLQEEGREDLLREGFLEQAWVGLRWPKRDSSEGMAAAVMACSSPVHYPKKFKQKSAAGRKVRISPDLVAVEAQEETLGLPSGLGAPQSGCDGTHALDGREDQSTGRLGRPGCIQRMSVRVGAPSGHRLEERVQSGAVRLTSVEATGPGLGIQKFYPLPERVPSTIQDAVVAEQEAIEDELLDYEEEEEAEEIHSGHQRAVQKGTTQVVAREANKKVVQSDRRVGRDRQVLEFVFMIWICE
ncbi:hypothetical protein NDU88_005235 [Pleurodeles waltl]|uniref:Uncharacterized protein n=1 Tax=Pleurodeles waltl TaxID=8319 RepID=A0AAV7TTQ7_PLEWA|nr:hypothetical protein NDU88_005235 [Pleurodeles waltl]